MWESFSSEVNKRELLSSVVVLTRKNILGSVSLVEIFCKQPSRINSCRAGKSLECSSGVYLIRYITQISRYLDQSRFLGMRLPFLV